MKKILLLVIIAVNFCYAQKTQPLSSGSSQQMGDAQMIRTIPNFKSALNYYLQAVKKDSFDIGLNFKIAVCYLNSNEKPKALTYLEAVKDKDPKFSEELNFLLGIAYHVNYQFDKAIASYEDYLKALKGSDFSSKTIMGPILNLIYDQRGPGTFEHFPVEGLGLFVNKRIQESIYAKDMVAHPKKAKVVNLGATINSKYAEYAPVITADESILYFTSRRPGLSQKTDSTDGTYFEDIYVTYNAKGVWSKPELLPAPVNTMDHDAVLALSSDGQKIFKYDPASNNGDILMSHLQGDKWGDFKSLPPNINSKEESERSIAISADENMIFFERDDTADGNRDIYFTYKIKDGSWIEAEKIGTEVNSPFDEDGIFFHPDGKTLYFSSNGHQSMGGYDIFKSVYSDGKWSPAENLGYPINTPDDDIFFVLSADGKHGYYSSISKDGVGDLDICLIEMPVPEKPDTTKPFSAVTLLTGTVTDKKNGLPLQASIQITDNADGRIISTLYTNSKTGKFIVSLPSGKNYGIAVVVKDEEYLFHSENFDLPKTHDYEKVTKDIKMQKVVKGSSIVLNNVFFDFNQSTLMKESMTELDRVLKVMKENPTLKVQIIGYTDNVGTAEYNQHLSELRAQEVAYFLMDRGIEKNRVKAVGMGMANPIASNTKDGKDDPEARKKNRRTEFLIIEK